MSNEADEVNPYTDRIRFYLEAYHNYRMHTAQKTLEALDFDMFMEFAYDLSEKAEPFL